MRPPFTRLTEHRARHSDAAAHSSQSKLFPLGMKAGLLLSGPSLLREAAMAARHLRVIVSVVLCFLSLQTHAETAALKANEPIRLESVTIGERSTELLIRFDRPISHGQSWISLVRQGKVVATIYPRLEAAPNVLFARIQTPGPGNYMVRWTVCPEGHNDRYDGEFPFTVGRVAGTAAETPSVTDRNSLSR